MTTFRFDLAADLQDAAPSATEALGSAVPGTSGISLSAASQLSDEEGQTPGTGSQDPGAPESGSAGLELGLAFISQSGEITSLEVAALALPAAPGGANVRLTDTIAGDTSTTASIVVGGSFTSRLEAFGDRDWIAVNLVAGQHYAISMDGTGANPVSDTYLRLMNAAGIEIAHDDDGGPDSNSLLTFTPTTSGRYYINAGGYDDGETGQYTIAVAQSAPPDFLDCINWGSRVADNTISVYFAPAGARYDGETSLGWNAYEIQQAMLAFQQFSNICNVTFTRTTNAAAADFRLLTSTSSEWLGYFNPPGETNEGVGVFARNGDGWEEGTPGTGGLQQGGYGFVTMIHEFGHGMGMAHPHDDGDTSTVWEGVTDTFDSFGTFDLNQGIYTTMSYNDGWQLHPSGENTAIPYGYQGTLMAFDIAMMQQIYGANTNFASGNSTYVLPQANAAGTYFSCIWDTGGTDEIVYNGSAVTQIDLRSAHLGYAEGSGGYISFATSIYGGFTIANGVVIENATGGSGADSIMGNTAANVLIGRGGSDSLIGGGGVDTLSGGVGIDTLFGGVGADVLKGGAGRDILIGGDGADDFYYYSRTDSGTTAATRDQINGFVSGVDDIMLRTMDADITDAPRDAFIWRGTAGFTGVAGQLRWSATAAGVVVQADLDGDRDVDFSLLLAGISSVLQADFLI